MSGQIAEKRRYIAEAYYKPLLCRRCNRTYMQVDAVVTRYEDANGVSRKIVRCPKRGAIVEEETE